MEKIPVRHIKATSGKTDHLRNFSIRTVQDLLLGENLIQELHRHDFYHILVLQKGAGFHEIDFRSYEIKDHTVFFVRPGQAHRLELNAASSGYMIQLSPNFYSSDDKTIHTSLPKVSRQNHYEPEKNTFQKILSILAYVFQEYDDKHENYIEIIKANLGIFFLELLREQNKNQKNNSNLYAQERLEEFMALLDTHILKHKQIASYAKMLHLTSYQLNAITRTLLSKKASELINEAIILECKRYLLATPNQVNQIAAYMGYEDVSYFIRFFKKHTGLSPETFRKNFK
ncbi:AraC family transcriptional regulator [Flavobacterium poyangense]|uniref:AraC family transcriptional regulator n=1 Tax=Flavobacterium poyangense TaxID=2204302 RepID=UPI0014210419|nr:helix-turn-helix transcriptional regulator [Flavobacterium sp. JXAS1]